MVIARLFDLGQVGEDGGALRIPAHHSVSSVDVAALNQLVELDAENVCVRTPVAVPMVL